MTYLHVMNLRVAKALLVPSWIRASIRACAIRHDQRFGGGVRDCLRAYPRRLAADSC